MLAPESATVIPVEQVPERIRVEALLSTGLVAGEVMTGAGGGVVSRIQLKAVALEAFPARSV